MDLTRNINPTQQHISEFVSLESGMIAHRFSIACTSRIAYEVYEPSQCGGAHSSITTIDGKWYGTLTTRPLPPEIDALPGYRPGFWPEERIAAVDAFHAELEQQAEAIIRQTFPQDFAGEEVPAHV